MSVNSFNGGDLFTATVYKHLASNPGQGFSNSYEFLATQAGLVTDVTDLAVALGEYEKALYYPDVVIDRVQIRTYQELPTDIIDGFLNENFNAAGTQPPGTRAPCALNIALYVRRDLPSGRPGKLLYRGLMDEAYMESIAGNAKLTAAGKAAYQANLDGALASSGLDAYIGEENPASFRMVVISPQLSGMNWRTVGGLSVVGISIGKFNHRWFDRMD